MLITAGFLLIIFFYHQGLNTGHTKFELDKATYYNENEARKDSIKLLRDSLKIVRVQYAELRKIEQGVPAEKLDSLKFLIILNDTLSITKKKLVEARQTIQQLQQRMSLTSKISTNDQRENEIVLDRIELAKIFNGSWTVIYLDSIVTRSGKRYQVNFDLLTSGRYFEQNIHAYNIEGIDISTDQKTIRFTKVPVNREGKRVEVDLLRKGFGYYKGTENGKSVDYKRQQH